MSVVRVWTLGSLEHKVLPTQEAVDRLAAILSKPAPDGGFDIIWDDSLKVTELKGDGEPNIVCGPGIKVTREGNVVKVEKDPAAEAARDAKRDEENARWAAFKPGDMK